MQYNCNNIIKNYSLYTKFIFNLEIFIYNLITIDTLHLKLLVTLVCLIEELHFISSTFIFKNKGIYYF